MIRQLIGRNLIERPLVLLQVLQAVPVVRVVGSKVTAWLSRILEMVGEGVPFMVPENRERRFEDLRSPIQKVADEDRHSTREVRVAECPSLFPVAELDQQSNQLVGVAVNVADQVEGSRPFQRLSV